MSKGGQRKERNNKSLVHSCHKNEVNKRVSVCPRGQKCLEKDKKDQPVLVEKLKSVQWLHLKVTFAQDKRALSIQLENRCFVYFKTRMVLEKSCLTDSCCSHGITGTNNVQSISTLNPSTDKTDSREVQSFGQSWKRSKRPQCSPYTRCSV